jgi:branched-subunit amino acid ABC-type transport system permease component
MLDSAAIAQFLTGGLTTGCGYALVALAIVVMANVSGVVNLAQGEYVAVGGLLLASLVVVHVPIAIALLVIATAGVVLGMVQERLTVQPIQSAPHFLQITVTLGVAVVIRGAAFLIWGKDPLGVPGFSGDGILVVAGAIFPVQTLWVWFGTALMLLVAFGVLSFTQIGRSVRACSINRTAARLMGINPQRTSMWVFAAAGAASTISGALLAPLTLASWDSGLTLGLKGLIAAVFGGFRSPLAAVVAGLAIGVLESFVSGLGSSASKDVVLYGLLLAGLLVMGGLFARGRERLHSGVSA